MMGESQNNRTYISGKIIGEGEQSHESHGESFYRYTVSIPRRSGVIDALPVTISERLLNPSEAVGKVIHARGALQSYNKVADGKSRLMLTVSVTEVLDKPQWYDPNFIEITGHLCKPPVYRTTPLNREVADLMIAVNRAPGKSDYIPAIAWGKNARLAKALNVGDKVTVQGRIQSREYQKRKPDGSEELRTVYEVSAAKLIALAEEDKNQGGKQ